MTPNVKRWDIIVRISVLLAIGCMVAGGGCSKPTGGLLTVEIAEKYVMDPSSENLTEFTSIEVAAAGVLGNHKGYLHLWGLTELSDAQAKALAKHDGPLHLDGLTKLSDSAAEALSKHNGFLGLDHDYLPPSASKILKDAGH